MNVTEADRDREALQALLGDHEVLALKEAGLGGIVTLTCTCGWSEADLDTVALADRWREHRARALLDAGVLVRRSRPYPRGDGECQACGLGLSACCTYWEGGEICCGNCDHREGDATGAVRLFLRNLRATKPSPEVLAIIEQIEAELDDTPDVFGGGNLEACGDPNCRCAGWADRRVCGADMGEGDECFLDAGHEGRCS